MNPNGSTLETSPVASAAAAPRAKSRAVWVAGGAAAIAAVGLSFAMVVSRSPGAASMAEVEGKPAAAAPAKKPVVATPKPAAPRAAAVATCAQCGVVESVAEVQVKGEGTGLGAVAGGLLGGVVGNQMGGGNGKKAMTVLGAVGGGLAGHEVEKRARATTSYVVKVRMDDKSLKTMTLPTAPKQGDRVEVDGDKLRPLPATSSANG